MSLSRRWFGILCEVSVHHLVSDRASEFFFFLSFDFFIHLWFQLMHNHLSSSFKKIKKKESSYLVESKLFSFAKDLFRQFSWLHYLPISLCHSLVKLRYTGLECSFIKVFMRLFSSEFIFYFYQCSSRTNAILRRKLHLR